MRLKLIISLIAGFLVLFLIGPKEVKAGSEGADYRSSDRLQFASTVQTTGETSLLLVNSGRGGGGHRGSRGHDGFRNRRFIHHRPAVIFRSYYYPFREYCHYPYPCDDYYYRRRYYQEGPAYNPQSLPITAIVEMTDKGVPESEIINEIQRTGSVFQLNAEVISYLKENRVSDRVIDYMLETGTRRGNTGY